MFILGVFETNGTDRLIENIKSLFSKHSLNISIISQDNIKDISVNDNSEKLILIKIPKNRILEQVYSDIEFDMIIHTNSDALGEITEPNSESHKMNLKLKDNCYAIINIDDDNYMKILEGLSGYILTYGFNSKATMTASSVDDNENKLSICQQRSIKTVSEKEVEPQEFSVNIKECDVENVYFALAAVTAGIVFNIDSNSIASNVF